VSKQYQDKKTYYISHTSKATGAKESRFGFDHVLALGKKLISDSDDLTASRSVGKI
jgi:hypothetical protein